MPTLRFKWRGAEFEYLGEQDDIIDFIARAGEFLSGSIASSVEPLRPLSPSVIIETKKEQMIDEKARPDKDVKNYILSKSHFAHDLFTVQKHFFGRTFRSRGNTKRMYHRTARQLRMIRKEIEKEHNGEFVEEIGEHGLKQFRFKKRPPSSWSAIGKETT